jgi:hypothetical protein
VKIKIGILPVLVALCGKGAAQGFVSLNFESAVINTNGAPPFSVVANNAMPGWAAYVGGNTQTYIIYNTINLDAAGVSIQGTITSIPSLQPIQGSYSIFLQGASQFVPQQCAAIGQTGQIPADAVSLIFWGNLNSSDVSFDDQNLPLIILGSTATYNIYGADISAFAGQTGQLLFTANPSGSFFLDNIQFSSSPVPEPGMLALCALGGVFLACRNRRVCSKA